MIQREVFNKYVDAYEAWYEKYPEVYQSELLAIKNHLETLPENIRGIEVGLGTGRFSLPLGIKEGVEPSEEMASKAVKRGIEVIKGYAEHLPYKDLQFDFVLCVTICHFDNVKLAFEEAHRVLKHKGALIVGFLDSNKTIAQEYKDRKQQSLFFRNATFYSVNHVKKIIEKAGFKNMELTQTLFGNLDAITALQQPKEGFDEGSFIVVKALKK